MVSLDEREAQMVLDRKCPRDGQSLMTVWHTDHTVRMCECGAFFVIDGVA